MPRAVEILTMDELAEAAIQLQYSNVVCVDDSWYKRFEVLQEIDRRVLLGKVINSGG